MADLQLVEGGRGQANFVCPWCGGSFSQRFGHQRGDNSLEGHWADRPECGRNKLASNATSSKYVTPDAPAAPPPGAHVLELVERNTSHDD